jgi:hypothetical protein
VGNRECAGHGGWRWSSPVCRLDDKGRRVAGTVALDDGGGLAVVTGDGRGLLHNRGGEGNVRCHLNRKEEGPRPAVTGEASRRRGLDGN